MQTHSESLKLDQESYANQNERWNAVATNDSAADGRFVYAVKSTGIYCRPSCKSRLPKPVNVTYFELPEAAEQAGFIACRRCKPRQSKPADPNLQAVQSACEMIAGADETAPTLDELATAVGISPHHFHREFKRIVGVTPRQFWDAGRVKRLKNNLKSGDGVAAAQYAAGYGSSSRLYEKSNINLGMTPATYGKGGKGALIAYSVTECSLGLLIVGATDKGICFLGLGDDEDYLVSELSGDFPNAELASDPAGLGEMVETVLAYLKGKEPHLDLPLDVRGTAFQRQVWQALVDIPYGETMTYRQIAESLGKPKAMRAVGRACATNPVSLIIPCHRAIGTDGGLRGYRWGLERKESLIATEQG